MYSRQMIDFRLPNQILDNAATFLRRKNSSDDKARIFASNQELLMAE